MSSPEKRVPNEAIVDFVFPETEDARTQAAIVAAAATSDPAVRERIVALQSVAATESDDDVAATLTDDRRDRLTARWIEIAQEVAATTAPPPAAGVWRGAGAIWETWCETQGSALLRLILGTAETGLRLPCLAPALAAPAAPTAASPGGALHIQREVITTHEGVHIEFQQLPGRSQTPRLRVVVDASRLRDTLAPVSSSSPSAGADDIFYNRALVMLEDTVANEPPGTLRGRHVLVVPLNISGRGYADIPVGSSDLAEAVSLPAPLGVCRLVAATLTREAKRDG